MSQAKQAISPLRQLMIQDMNLRKLAPKTQKFSYSGFCGVCIQSVC